MNIVIEFYLSVLCYYSSCAACLQTNKKKEIFLFVHVNQKCDHARNHFIPFLFCKETTLGALKPVLIIYKDGRIRTLQTILLGFDRSTAGIWGSNENKQCYSYRNRIHLYDILQKKYSEKPLLENH